MLYVYRVYTRLVNNLSYNLSPRSFYNNKNFNPFARCDLIILLSNLDPNNSLLEVKKHVHAKSNVKYTNQLYCRDGVISNFDSA